MSYDSYSYNEYDAFFGGFLILIILLFLVVGVIGYIVSALIYFMTSKTNGFSDLAYIAWIPIINVYSLFLLTAPGHTNEAVRAAALKNTLIYAGLILLSYIPIIGILSTIGAAGFALYFIYRLFYRWSGETGKAVLYLILTIITCGLFFAIYGLMHMNRSFVA